MNTITNHISTVLILIVSLLLAWLLTTSANAKLIETEKHYLKVPDESMGQQILEFCDRINCIRYLRDNGLIKSFVTDEELDRYFTMAKQNCDGDNHVYPALILAVIAVESNFDKDAFSNSGARGLMQMMPMYHTSSLSQFKGSPANRDDFFVPEWNIACGTAYLSQLIEQALTYETVDDPIGFALMCYNQGPASASKSYFSNEKHLSGYARRVLDISEDLQEILSKGDVYRAKT